jgi:tetratricopeptide (TPR) repeat protein
VHRELGLAYRRRGDKYNSAGEKQKGEVDYEKAIEELKRAIEQNPGDDDALGVLGGLYRRKGDYMRAMEYYRQAVDVDPESSYALGNVASLAWYLGNEELASTMFVRTEKAARKRLDTLKSLEPYWDYFDIALAQLVLRETEAAKETYKNAIELTPSKVHFDSVVHNLSMLKSSNKGQPIPGIDEVIEMIERAR